jgi:hypothetical protein
MKRLGEGSGLSLSGRSGLSRLLVFLGACSDPGTSSPDKEAATSSTADTGASKAEPTTTEASAEDGSVGTGDASTGGSTNGADGPCENPEFTCSEPLQCPPGAACGALEQFDAGGCLRRECERGEDCDPDERCYRPTRFAECSGTVTVSCEDVEGECACTSASGVASFCVAASDYPSVAQTPCSLDCAAPGNLSHLEGMKCLCDEGFVWCKPDAPTDYTCCEG